MSDQELAEKIESWAALIADDARAANNGLMPDAEDRALLARTMRDTALRLKHRDVEVLWDESKASLQVELERLGLTALISDEECDGGAPGDLDQWSYIIRLCHEDLNHLRDVLSCLLDLQD